MKKVVSLLLVLSLAIGMVTVASAAKYDASLNDWEKVDDVGDLLAQTGREYTWALPADDFQITTDAGNVAVNVVGQPATSGGTIKNVYDTNGDGIIDRRDTGVLSWDAVKNAKIVLKARVRAGSDLIEEYKLESYTPANQPNNANIKAARIYLEFKEFFRNADPDGKDFEIIFYYTIDGDRTEDYLTVEGNYANEEIEVDDLDDYVDISQGEIVTSDAYNSGIDVDLGEGIIIHSKLFKDKHYWGHAIAENDEADDVVFKAYPDIERVYTLDVIGLNSTAQWVEFDNAEDGSHFVYGLEEDGNLTYLGKSNANTPFYKKYYLANKELDVVAVDEPVDEGFGDDEGYLGEDDEILPPATTGGDDTYPTNINDNPGTGK